MKFEGKRPLGRTWLKWENNLKIDYTERENCYLDWINMAQDMDTWCSPVNQVNQIYNTVKVLLIFSVINSQNKNIPRTVNKNNLFRLVQIIMMLIYQLKSEEEIGLFQQLQANYT